MIRLEGEISFMVDELMGEDYGILRWRGPFDATFVFQLCAPSESQFLAE